MSKFKVGDKVKVIKDHYKFNSPEEVERAEDGYIYTIYEWDGDEEFPEYILNVLDGWETDITDTGHGWWVDGDNLQLVILETRIGGELV